MVLYARKPRRRASVQSPLLAPSKNSEGRLRKALDFRSQSPRIAQAIQRNNYVNNCSPSSSRLNATKTSKFVSTLVIGAGQTRRQSFLEYPCSQAVYAIQIEKRKRTRLKLKQITLVETISSRFTLPRVQYLNSPC